MWAQIWISHSQRSFRSSRCDVMLCTHSQLHTHQQDENRAQANEKRKPTHLRSFWRESPAKKEKKRAKSLMNIVRRIAGILTSSCHIVPLYETDPFCVRDVRR